MCVGITIDETHYCPVIASEGVFFYFLRYFNCIVFHMPDLNTRRKKKPINNYAVCGK